MKLIILRSVAVLFVKRESVTIIKGSVLNNI